MIVGLGLVALVASAFAYPAAAAKSKMGCEIGKEVWNASAGKCEPGTYKKTAKSSGKKPEKK
jgi:hypothetical protein